MTTQLPQEKAGKSPASKQRLSTRQIINQLNAINQNGSGITANITETASVGSEHGGDFRIYAAHKQMKFNEASDSYAQNNQDSDIFARCVCFINAETNPPASELKTMLLRNGGRFLLLRDTGMETHYVCDRFTPRQVQLELERKHPEKSRTSVSVTSAWITESLKAGRRLNEADFSPFPRVHGGDMRKLFSGSIAPERSPAFVRPHEMQTSMIGNMEVSNVISDSSNSCGTHGGMNRASGGFFLSSSHSHHDSEADPAGFLAQFLRKSRLHFIGKCTNGTASVPCAFRIAICITDHHFSSLSQMAATVNLCRVLERPGLCFLLLFNATHHVSTCRHRRQRSSDTKRNVRPEIDTSFQPEIAFIRLLHREVPASCCLARGHGLLLCICPSAEHPRPAGKVRYDGFLALALTADSRAISAKLLMQSILGH